MTLARGAQQAHVVLRVDSAATYYVLERPWAVYFGLIWDEGAPVSIGTAVGSFQAYLHVLSLQIDRFRWDASVAIAEFESPPGGIPRQVLGLVGFFDRFRVTIEDQDERIMLVPHF